MVKLQPAILRDFFGPVHAFRLLGYLDELIEVITTAKMKI
jgi:hypothetical protein